MEILSFNPFRANSPTDGMSPAKAVLILKGFEDELMHRVLFSRDARGRKVVHPSMNPFRKCTDQERVDSGGLSLSLYLFEHLYLFVSTCMMVALKNVILCLI